jgi:light-regulated signal transduction histidine kinase (bacteriophytochrome)
MLANRYRRNLDANADEMIQFVLRGVAEMRELVNGLLEYSKVGTKKVELETVDLGAIVGHAVRNLKLAIEESHAIVTIGDLPNIQGDRVQLLQLFQNLFANSIKFRGTETPQIRVSAEGKGEWWTFCVRDNGIGFDPRFSEEIFGVFRRLHKQEYPGSGLGLAICKRNVERHGGKIWAESQPGRGASFFVRLPRYQERPQTEQNLERGDNLQTG